MAAQQEPKRQDAQAGDMIAAFNARGTGTLPGYLGMEVTCMADREVHMRLEIKPHHLAPNGYLHAGTVISLADTSAGYACIAHLPEGGANFTTVELKANMLGTARSGAIVSVAKAVHLGRTTQVWDATVSDESTGKTIAVFRCTQLILAGK
jgi:uncharacterized protein (TIGR00369 family)